MRRADFVICVASERERDYGGRWERAELCGDAINDCSSGGWEVAEEDVVISADRTNDESSPIIFVAANNGGKKWRIYGMR